jgi:hypothetical protein
MADRTDGFDDRALVDEVRCRMRELAIVTLLGERGQADTLAGDPDGLHVLHRDDIPDLGHSIRQERPRRTGDP